MSTAEAHPWQVTTDGKDPSIPEGARDVHGHYHVDVSEIPMTPQEGYKTCLSHGVATIIWLLMMKKYGPQLTPCKQSLLTTIMAACDGYRARVAATFMCNVQAYLNERNSNKVYFPVQDDQLVAISVKIVQISEYDSVVKLLKTQPVLVKVIMAGNSSHIVCALSAKDEDKGKYLDAYHSDPGREIVQVRQDSQAPRCQFINAFRVDVTLDSLLDIDMNEQQLPAT